jgi:hypothetical protein
MRKLGLRDRVQPVAAYESGFVTLRIGCNAFSNGHHKLGRTAAVPQRWTLVAGSIRVCSRDVTGCASGNVVTRHGNGSALARRSP